MRDLNTPRLRQLRIPHPMGPVPNDLTSYAGAFNVPIGGTIVRVIASRGGDVWGRTESGAEWDHVSASCVHRCPTWAEMCHVKDLFFEPDEVAMQLHPVADYINNHPFCLHLWRPLHTAIPLPPSILVGLKELNR